MTSTALTSTCARHAEAAATFACSRCGVFGCVDCERREDPRSAPFCPSCWALRPASLAPGSGTGLQTAGLVLGVVSIFPFCPLWLASLVVNAVALVKANTPLRRRARWQPIVGLVLTAVFALGWAVSVALWQLFAKSSD